MDNDLEGRVRGRTAGLRRAVAARLKLVAAAAIVGGLVVSLAMTFADSAGKHFEYALFGELYGAFLLLGGLLALFTWWRYRAALGRLPGVVARSSGQPEVTSTHLGSFYSKGSLGASTGWERPSLAGEDDEDPNRPPR
jgi:hypothetical protein